MSTGPEPDVTPGAGGGSGGGAGGEAGAGSAGGGPGRGFGERWRAVPPGARVVTVVAGLVLAVNVGLAGLDAITGRGPSGPTSSSYATTGAGLAAYADLLAAYGHPVVRLRVPLGGADLDPGSTLVVADPREMGPAEGRALARFVGAGGRLVVSGPGTAAALRSLAGAPAARLQWSPAAAGRSSVVVPAGGIEGTGDVVSNGPGTWVSSGAFLPVVAGPGGDLAAVHQASGGGTVLALASTSSLQNRVLAEAGNAALGLALAGGEGRTVVFAEEHHGFGRDQGLAALPGRWRWALGWMAVAAAAGLWSHGRRLGPPETVTRELPPPRRAYVDAVAATLARTRRPAEAMRPLQEAARRRVGARAGLAPDAPEAEVVTAAVRLGLTEDEAGALSGRLRTEPEIMAAARALARLERTGR